MFRILRALFNLVIFVALAALLAYLIIDPSMVKMVLEEVMNNFDNSLYQIIAIIVLIVYFVAFFLSYLEKILKKNKKTAIKSKDKDIEVNFSTLENIAKSYLESNKIIKNVKVSVVPTSREPNIDAVVECYNTYNLNLKLADLKKELEEHIFSMLGIKPRKIFIKLSKIDDQVVVEKEMYVTENENVEEKENVEEEEEAIMSGDTKE